MIGASGLPGAGRAGDVLRTSTTLKLSFRLPPTADSRAALAELEAGSDDGRAVQREGRTRPATEWLDGSGIEVDNGVVCDEAGRTSAPNVWALGDVASWRDPMGHQAHVEHWSNVAEQARVVVPAMLGRDAPANVVVPYFWSDQYDVKIQCLGEPHATDIVHLVEDDGRKFLAYYERDGVLVGVVGGGLPGKVMKVRGKIAAGTPISEMLT